MSQGNRIEPSLPIEFKEHYHFDSERGCWIARSGAGDFAYSDGDEVERRIYETVRSAGDLSSVSVELAKKITDWPSKYHLSALRGNLLRPFSHRLNGRVLEIGAGCGAITRFLGECGGEVVAVEGSQARASIAAARCRDLQNVNVIVDAVHRLPPCPTYDVVTLVGVLEYARKYFPGEEHDRVINLMRHAKKFLKPEGVLILAIENQLGLKYFAGSDEDHVGVPMFGIEDRYTTAGVVTFGRRELQEMLASAGFPGQSWWYPFPDYKLPTVLISEKALSGLWGTKLHTLVGAALEMDPQLPESPLFNLERAWRPVVRNGLGPYLANSFFVFAGMQQTANDFEEIAEAYHFAVERKPEYAKMVIFKLCDPPKMTVQQKLLYPELRSLDHGPIKMTLDQSEEFVEGQLWSQKLKSILSTEGWLFADLVEWARYWYLELLREAELNQNTQELNSSTLVPGGLIDAIPRNLILRDNGEGAFIDKEWFSTSPVELGYVVFRGLFLSLIYVGSIASPEPGVPLERASVFKNIAKLLGLVVTDSDLGRYANLENDFQLRVKGMGVGDPKGIISSRLEIRTTERIAHQSYHRDGSFFEEIKNEISGKNVKVSIVIPVFNKLEFTKKCIESIINNTPKCGYEIIVIDNGSTDGTNAYLKSIQGMVRTICNPKNAGFSKACNQGIRAATGPYVLFLNNDTEPQPGWLEPLVDVLDRDPSVAAVGSKLLFPDRTIQHAGVVIALHSRSGNICPFHIYYKERSDLPAANRMMEYAVCTAACIITRAERLRWLGGFDERFWNGYEDVDLCLRFCQNGWRVVYEPKSVLIHHESQSGPERFSKERQNTELLQKKWRNMAPIDIIIHPDGKISQKEDTRIRCYTNSGPKETSSEDRSDEKQKCDKSTYIKGMTSIIMLTFNQLKYTQECVDSIKKYTSEPHEIIFVDNGSSDGTAKWLKDIVAKNSNYKVIANKKNLGFSKGCNQGIKASSGEYIVLLNNDAVVTENWIDGMLECLNHDTGIGIVGPMTNNISGPQQVPFADYSSIADLDRYSREFRIKNRHRRITSRRVVGFCMLFKRQLIEEIGVLDEAFGSGNFEDDDFCLRSVLAGYRNMIAGDVFIHHYGSRTFIGNRIDYGSSLSGNRRIFIEKWSGEEVAQRFGAKLAVENAAAKAHELFDRGDIEKATACLLGALKQAPCERRLYFKLAEMLTDEKRFQDAVDILEALKVNGSDSRQAALLGYCEEALGHDEKARENSEHALAIDPRDALATNVLGVLAFKKGQQDAAENYFRKARELDPALGESYTNLGSIKWAAGKTEDALKLFERGFILSPTINDVAAAYHTAVVETKSFESAEAVVREARALHPNHKRIAFLLIALLLQQEKHESAMQEIEKAMIQFGIDDGILSAGLEIRKRIGALAIEKPNRRKATLSLCMIVKNEEPHLARCLMSVKPIVDEMIVVDTGSDDRTKSIAAVLGAKVFNFAWTNDFSEARNFSLAKASGDWILVLDADEVVSPADHGVLRKITKKRPEKRVAYTMVTRNYTNNPGAGGWVANEGRYADEEVGKGWVSSTKVRLFAHDKRVQFVNPVHELVEPVLSKLGIPIKACDVPVHHYGRLDQGKLIAKGKQYYRLGLAKIDQTRGDYSSLKEFAIQASEIGEYDEAVKVWRKVIELQPNDAAAHMNMGYALLMMRKYHQAAESSKTAMKIDPEVREAALNYAGAEMIAGDVHAAVSTLEHLLEKHADYPPAMGRLAAAYIVSGRKEDGLRMIQKLNSRGYDGVSALEEQARAFMAESKFETALLLLTAAVEKGVGNGSLNDLLADCRSKIVGSSDSDNPIDFSGSLQRLPSQLHGDRAAL